MKIVSSTSICSIYQVHQYFHFSGASKPTNLTSLSRGFSTLTVSWGPPEEPNGAIKKYKISCLEGNDVIHSDEVMAAMISPNNTYIYTCLNLERGTSYTVEVG